MCLKLRHFFLGKNIYLKIINFLRKSLEFFSRTKVPMVLLFVAAWTPQKPNHPVSSRKKAFVLCFFSSEHMGLLWFMKGSNMGNPLVDFFYEAPFTLESLRGKRHFHPTSKHRISSLSSPLHFANGTHPSHVDLKDIFDTINTKMYTLKDWGGYSGGVSLSIFFEHLFEVNAWHVCFVSRGSSIMRRF